MVKKRTSDPSQVRESERNRRRTQTPIRPTAVWVLNEDAEQAKKLGNAAFKKALEKFRKKTD